MGEIIDLNEKRRQMEARKEAIDCPKKEINVIEEIREFLKPALFEGPALRMVENKDAERKMDKKGFARFMMQVQSGKIVE